MACVHGRGGVGFVTYTASESEKGGPCYDHCCNYDYYHCCDATTTMPTTTATTTLLRTTITATTATTTTTSPTTTTTNYYDHCCYDDDDLRLLPLRCGGGPSRTPPNSYHYHWHYNYDYHYNDDYHYYYHYYHYHYYANGRWVMCGEEGGRKPREKPRKVGLEAMLVRRAPTWNRTTEHRGMWHGQKLGDFEQHGRV